MVDPDLLDRQNKYMQQSQSGLEVLLQMSVSAGPRTWRFVLSERRDGRSSLRLDVVDPEIRGGRETIVASFIVASSGDITRC